MNRGNLAEDPRSGLSSSSRYSRNGGEKNSLLYVDSSSLRKERRAAERRAGNQASTIKGNHNSKRKKSVGRGLADSHMDRLEVGSDGRLFRVKESSESASSMHKQGNVETTAASAHTSTLTSSDSEHTNQPAAENTANAAPQIRPAITGEIITQNAKPQRSYLTQENPLLKKKPAKNAGFKRRAKAKTAVASQEESAAAEKPAASGEVSTPAVRETEAANEQSAPAVKETEERNEQSAPAVKETEAANEQSAPAVKETDERNAQFAPGIRTMLRRFRVPIIVSAVTLASAGYGYAAWHYSDRFYPGTEFFGIPAAELSVYDVKAAVKAKVDSYSLQLEARKPFVDSSEQEESAFASKNVIDAEDVEMVYSDNNEIDDAMKRQRSWAWPVMMLAQLFGERNSAFETSYNADLVPEAVSNLACMQKSNMIKPQNAQVALTDDGARVQTEIYGTTLDVEKTEEAVKKALNDGCTSIDLDALGLYVNPKVNSSDLSLASKAMAMNKVLGAKILLRFGNRTEVINSEVIARFLTKEGSSYTLNEEKVRRYVSRLAKKYDTYQCEREFFTSIGTKVTLEEGIGDYGWLLDQEAVYEQILEAIRSQKKTTITPIFTREAYCADADDIGDTYVEISLTNQMMWFYKNGMLVVKTPVVTGNPYAGHETPSGGVWSLKGKMRNQTLSGQGYASPVDYWMPFNNGVGIHDMQSRAYFGGTIYLGSGSHGCVNTPLSAVKLIYDQIEEGVPVIVYKDESEEAYAHCTDPVDVQSLNAQIEDSYGTVEDDGIGSIVAWSRSKAAQAAVSAQQAAVQNTTPVT